MLTALKLYLRKIFFPSVYTGGMLLSLYAFFKDAWWGFLLLIALIPQPNIWHKFYELPMGKDFMDILFIMIFLGIFVQHKKIPITVSGYIIIFFLVYTYWSLWLSSYNFGLPRPISRWSYQLMEWKNFAQMILIYFMSLTLAKNENQQKLLFTLMSSVIFFMALRNYRNFSGGSAFQYDKRVGGPFFFVGLGATHYGAFMAHFPPACLGMSFFEKDLKKKLFYILTFAICLHPLFFSYSRGAYIGTALALLFFGLFKKRSILVAFVVLYFVWQAVLPPSVVDRISGSVTATGELEGSASSRLHVWDQAGRIISNHPLIGVGWEGFGLSIPIDERIHGLTDTHNYYVKTLCDRGIIGLALLMLIFGKALHSGFILFIRGKSTFHQGLGLSFIGTVLACMVTNFFGDRFTYFVLGSYFWMLWGLVDRSLLGISQTRETYVPMGISRKFY